MPERKPADKVVGAARAVIGQGLGMGWGDEAEAWLRSKLPGSKGYDAELAQINREYAQYSKENPFVAPALEFGGGVLPVVASAFIPGGQAAAPATAARTAGALNRLRTVAISPVGRTVGTGVVTGAVSGAGSAQPGDRTSGAASGAIIGGGVGAAAPVIVRGGGAGARWLRERVAPSEAKITERAAEKVNKALAEAELTPQQAADIVAADRARNIPSTLANVSRPTVSLAETVTQRAGKAPDIVEDVLEKQRLGARERTYAQAKQGIGGGSYYDDEQRIIQDLRSKSDPAYKTAYAVGEVNDPQIMEMLALPQFRGAWNTARQIAEADAAAAQVNAMRTGQAFDPEEFKLRNIYSITRDMETGAPIGVEVTGQAPDVRTLDYMKRALDAQISAGYKSDNAATLASANAYKDLRNALRDRTKEVVPEYAQALQVYKGDKEILDALQSGMNDFGKMDHEEVIRLVKGMSPTEMDAFRTGVVRDIYSRIMNTSGNMNAAQRVIGAPEMQAKLQPLFDSPAKFELFKAALERESQLFQQSNRILAGSPTGRRLAAREAFEEGPGVGQVVGDAITGGFWGSLTNAAARFARSATMTDELAEKTAKLLMSSDPAEVAAAVKLLESQAAAAAPKAAKVTRKELGLTTGTTASFPSPPLDETAPADIESDLGADVRAAPTPGATGPDIEADIQRLEKSRKVPGPAMVGPDIEADLSDPKLR
jgi:hypothetical protein